MTTATPLPQLQVGQKVQWRGRHLRVDGGVFVRWVSADGTYVALEGDDTHGLYDVRLFRVLKQ